MLSALVEELWMDELGGTGTWDDDILEELLELSIGLNGTGDETWSDTTLLVLGDGTASENEDLRNEIIENGSHVDWGRRGDTLGITTLAEATVDTTDWELEVKACGTGTWGSGLWGHFEYFQSRKIMKP